MGCCCVVWCGVVRCGAVRCVMVWCGVMWCSVVWSGVVKCGVLRCGMWCGVVVWWAGVLWGVAVCMCGCGALCGACGGWKASAGAGGAGGARDWKHTPLDLCVSYKRKCHASLLRIVHICRKAHFPANRLQSRRPFCPWPGLPPSHVERQPSPGPSFP